MKLAIKLNSNSLCFDQILSKKLLVCHANLSFKFPASLVIIANEIFFDKLDLFLRPKPSSHTLILNVFDLFDNQLKIYQTLE